LNESSPTQGHAIREVIMNHQWSRSCPLHWFFI
jgi:hypothetical protein